MWVADSLQPTAVKAEGAEGRLGVGIGHSGEWRSQARSGTRAVRLKTDRPNPWNQTEARSGGCADMGRCSSAPYTECASEDPPLHERDPHKKGRRRKAVPTRRSGLRRCEGSAGNQYGLDAIWRRGGVGASRRWPGGLRGRRFLRWRRIRRESRSRNAGRDG